MAFNQLSQNVGYQQIYGIGSKGAISPIQSVTGVVTNTNTFIDVAISSVLQNDTIIFGSQELNNSQVQFNNTVCQWALTSSTNIRITRDGTSGSSDQVNLFVQEFPPDTIKSTQTITIALAASATTATGGIASIDLNKAFPIAYGAINTSGTLSNAGSFASQIGVSFDDSTTVRITAAVGQVLAVTYAFQIVEFR